MLKTKIIKETSHEPLEKKRHKQRLRPNHHLMEPEELRPEERWDRIVELLALMTMPEVPAQAEPEKEVLMNESNY